MSVPLKFEVEYKSYCDQQLIFECAKYEKWLREFVKPEDLNPRIVSHPFGFFNEQYSKGLEEFGVHLKRLVGQPYYVWKPQPRSTDSWHADEDEDVGGVLRLVISSDAPLYDGDSDTDSDSEDEEDRWSQPQKVTVTPLMKVKLIPDYPDPMEYPFYEKEQHYLAKLARVCGPQNLVFEMASEYDEDELWCRGVQLLWNEQENVWEGETEIRLKTMALDLFRGKFDKVDEFDEGEAFKVSMWSFKVKVNEDGIKSVFQHTYSYSKCGLDSGALREMLDEGRFSDVVIVSDCDDDDDKKEEIKAHRMLLTAASTVFADMLNSNWTEGKTCTVKLPESEETLKTMLHFIYYGGTDRILAAGPEVVLELLQAGHKYMIENLIEVAAMTLRLKMGLEQWFSVDAAVELICFARNVEGKLWKELMKRSCKFLEGKTFDELKTSEGYLKLYQISKKLGPVFESVLTMSEDGIGSKAGNLPKVPVGMVKEEVALIYDFLTACSVGGDKPRTLEIAVGMVVLAEYCGRASPTFTYWFIKEYLLSKGYTADLLVELFCTARTKEDECWGFFKRAAVKKLKKLFTEQPKEMEASTKYQEMRNTNQEAAKELAQLTGLALEETTKAKKRKRT